MLANLQKNFTKNLFELFQKTLAVAVFLAIGMAFGVAVTLTVIGMTPTVFVDVMSEYNASSIALPFLALSIIGASFWQFATLASDELAV